MLSIARKEAVLEAQSAFLDLESLVACLLVHKTFETIRPIVLRAVLEDIGAKIKYPFGSSAYCFGANGEYFSMDSLEPHADIPARSVPRLCALVRAWWPGRPFTSLRLQQLDAAHAPRNHRTLAFSLGGEGEVLLTAVGPGGYDCVRVDRAWQTVQGRLTSFSGGAEQMWQWPPAGVVYSLAAWAESRETLAKLSDQELRHLDRIGFVMPLYAPNPEAATPATVSNESGPAVRTARAPNVARVVLGLPEEVSGADVRRAFRQFSRQHHPDLGGDPATWSRLCWARGVLLRQLGEEDEADDEPALAIEA